MCFNFPFASYLTESLSGRLFVVVNVLLLFAVITPYAQAQNPLSAVMDLKPGDCIVLKQGKSCYTTVNIVWKSSAPDDFCLRSSNSEIESKCWSRTMEGAYKSKVSVEEDTEFYLVHQSTQLVLDTKTLVVGWVYEKSNRPIRSWRLF